MQVTILYNNNRRFRPCKGLYSLAGSADNKKVQQKASKKMGIQSGNLLTSILSVGTMLGEGEVAELVAQGTQASATFFGMRYNISVSQGASTDANIVAGSNRVEIITELVYFAAMALEQPSSEVTLQVDGNFVKISVTKL